MAYTQKPGRGNNPKTGYSMPAPFMQSKPDYAKADRQEKEIGYGATSSAAGVLKNYPQAKNLKGINSKVATEQIQIASDSLNYISGGKNVKEKAKLSKDFFNTYSTNNPNVKKKLSAGADNEYQGVTSIGSFGKGAGSQAAKADVLGKLVAQGAKTFGKSDDSGMPNFGIPKIGTMENPRTSLKKSPTKQMKSKMKSKMKTPAKMKSC